MSAVRNGQLLQYVSFFYFFSSLVTDNPPYPPPYPAGKMGPLLREFWCGETPGYPGLFSVLTRSPCFQRVKLGSVCPTGSKANLLNPVAVKERRKKGEGKDSVCGKVSNEEYEPLTGGVFKDCEGERHEVRDQLVLSSLIG